MSNLNWPESATHYGAETLQFNPGFYKKDGETWLFMSEYFAPNGCWNRASKDDDPSRYIERPKQPQAWSGPEDGLPPVGVTCERRFDDLEDSSWQQMTVIAYGKRKVFYSDKNGDEWGHFFTELEFRAIPTPDQKRKSAIRELMDIAKVDCRVTAARLVDAGFKREGV